MSLAATCYVVVVVLSLISFLQAKGRRNKSCISEFMLHSLPLENTVNMSSQLENSVRYHFPSDIYPVVNWEISKHPHLSHLASLTLLGVYLAQNMLKTPYKKP